MLTEEVMAPGLLQQIIEYTAQGGRATVSDLTWLYRFVAIEPIVISGQTLIYRLALPVLNEQSYLLFTVHTMPVPISHSDMSVKINLHAQYGVSTRTGQMFMPNTCMGVRPVVCRSGPLFKANVMKCARGLIFNQTGLIHECKFDLSKGDNATLIQQIAQNQYLLSTWGETLKLRCPMEVELAVKIAPGTYDIKCQPPCVIEGETFQLDCIETYHLKRDIELPRLRIKGQFNFSRNLQSKDLLSAFPSLKDTPAGVIPAVDSLLIESAIALNEGGWKTISRHAPVLTIVLTGWFIMMFIVSGFAYYVHTGARYGPQCLRGPRPGGTPVPRVAYHSPQQGLAQIIINHDSEEEDAQAV
jgi:hypothetical protein